MHETRRMKSKTELIDGTHAQKICPILIERLRMNTLILTPTEFMTLSLIKGIFFYWFDTWFPFVWNDGDVDAF